VGQKWFSGCPSVMSHVFLVALLTIYAVALFVVCRSEISSWFANSSTEFHVLLSINCNNFFIYIYYLFLHSHIVVSTHKVKSAVYTIHSSLELYVIIISSNNCEMGCSSTVELRNIISHHDPCSVIHSKCDASVPGCSTAPCLLAPP